MPKDSLIETLSLLVFISQLVAWVLRRQRYVHVALIPYMLHFISYLSGTPVLVQKVYYFCRKSLGRQLASFYIHSISRTETRNHSCKPSLHKSNDWASFNCFAYFFSAQFLANSPLFWVLKIHLGAAWGPSESTKGRAAWVSYALLSNASKAFPTNGDVLVIGIHKYRNLPFPEAIACRSPLACSI